MNHDRNATSAGHSASASSSGQPSSRWQDHPLVRQQYFHVLPLDILEEVEPLLDLDYCKQLPWRLERRLSKAASAQPDTVCFWDGRHPIKHPFLYSHPHEEEEDAGGSDAAYNHGIILITLLKWCRSRHPPGDIPLRVRRRLDEGVERRSQGNRADLLRQAGVATPAGGICPRVCDE